MKIIHFGKKERQFKHLVRQFKKMMQTAPSSLKARNLILQIRHEIGFLQKIISGSKMRRILGPTAIMLGISFGSLQAQSFGTPQANPFGLDVATASSNNLESQTTFNDVVDIDNDGDLDILVTTYYGEINLFENTGSSTSPVFNSVSVSPFGFNPTIPAGSYIFPHFVDIDGDGDHDILGMNNEFQTMEFYENTGTPSSPDFSGTAQANPFGFSLPNHPAGGEARPYFLESVDLDGDGDYDLMSTGLYYDGANPYSFEFFFYENTGSSTAPSFAAPQKNPFGLTNDPYFTFPSFSDIDSDGDLDMIVGEAYSGNFNYYENTGTSTSPTFATAVQNPFGLSPVNEYANLAFADFDNDGDDDILVVQYFEYASSDDLFVYFENTTITSIDEAKNDFALSISPNPARNTLNIQATENISEVRILDILGKQVYLDSYQGEDIQIGNLSSGTYFVKIFSEDGGQATKMIQKL